MEFSEEILKNIILLGQQGFSILRISGELNLTFDALCDLRKENKQLDDALTRAELNYYEYWISEFERGNLKVQKEFYLSAKQKRDISDNKIEIERV